MSIKLENISFESVISSLFSNEEEGALAEDNTVITLDPEVIEELTEEEGEIVEIPTDPDEIIVDESEVAEESMRLCGEVRTMELAMITAEQYMWKESLEADKVKPEILKKFWEWLKKIMTKIKEFLLTAFKRIQIWLAGDMKNTVKFATDNKADIEKAISAKGDEVTLKIKKPLKNPDDIKLIMNPSAFHSAAISLGNGTGDEAIVAELAKISAQTTSGVADEIYGPKAKATDVKLADFDKAVGGIYKLLTNAAAIKTNANTMNASIKVATDAIKAFDKAASKETDKEKLADVKKLATALQKAVSVSSSVQYWKIAALISMVKIAKAYANKAMKANKPGKVEGAKAE
jgi:hypothetical protein